jgi:hypothetical protein
MKSAITSIKFKIGEKEIELSADEAREIYCQLKLLFVQANENPFIIKHPAPACPQPILWESQPWPQPYRVTCTSDSKATLTIIS